MVATKKAKYGLVGGGRKTPSFKFTTKASAEKVRDIVNKAKRDLGKKADVRVVKQ